MTLVLNNIDMTLNNETKKTQGAWIFLNLRFYKFSLKTQAPLSNSYNKGMMFLYTVKSY